MACSLFAQSGGDPEQIGAREPELRVAEVVDGDAVLEADGERLACMLCVMDKGPIDEVGDLLTRAEGAELLVGEAVIDMPPTVQLLQISAQFEAKLDQGESTGS